MSLNEEEILRIKEALILTAHYTGDNKYMEILDKIAKMEKEWKENQKRIRKF